MKADRCFLISRSVNTTDNVLLARHGADSVHALKIAVLRINIYFKVQNQIVEPLMPLMI